MNSRFHYCPFALELAYFDLDPSNRRKCTYRIVSAAVGFAFPLLSLSDQSSLIPILAALIGQILICNFDAAEEFAFL